MAYCARIPAATGAVNSMRWSQSSSRSSTAIRFPKHSEFGVWRGLRADLELRLQRIALHPPKRAMDIPEPYAKLYFDLMPIHEKLRGRDFVTTHNYLKVTLCNIHDELTKRLEPMVLTA